MPPERTGARHQGMLVRVEAPHFVAGLIVKNQRVVATAPILAWARGMGVVALEASIKRKRWDWQVLDDGSVDRLASELLARAPARDGRSDPVADAQGTGKG
jgi:hypothetical protein